MSYELIPSEKKMPLQKFVTDLAGQLEDVKTTTDERKGFATVTGKKDGKRLSFVIDQCDIGETRTASVYNDLTRKSDYAPEVKRLRNQGLKQKDIALRLGISQPFVSKLLNE